MGNLLAANFSGLFPEAGTDEAGRGCLAGAVFAAAVILPENFYHEDLNDSKQISEKKRNELRHIIEKEALAWSVQQVDEEEIDQINILNASIKAMHLSLNQLALTPAYVIVDGNRFKPWGHTPYSTQIKGDGRFLSIAAASILAKTHRDEYMLQLHDEFPVYGWNVNKGYATANHRAAIEKFGACKYHRKSFTLTKKQMSFDF